MDGGHRKVRGRYGKMRMASLNLSVHEAMCLNSLCI